jgi:hypothetical protein
LPVRAHVNLVHQVLFASKKVSYPSSAVPGITAIRRLVSARLVQQEAFAQQAHPILSCARGARIAPQLQEAVRAVPLGLTVLEANRHRCYVNRDLTPVLQDSNHVRLALLGTSVLKALSIQARVWQGRTAQKVLGSANHARLAIIVSQGLWLPLFVQPELTQQEELASAHSALPVTTARSEPLTLNLVSEDSIPRQALASVKLVGLAFTVLNSRSLLSSA